MTAEEAQDFGLIDKIITSYRDNRGNTMSDDGKKVLRCSFCGKQRGAGSAA